MCEIYGFSGNRKMKLNKDLREFYSHSADHPNGWGLALLDEEKTEIFKEVCRADRSGFLKEKLGAPIKSKTALAHIRLATIGNVEQDNCHPFTAADNSGRTWTLIHNGTVFECDRLNKYIFLQKGETDSERILLYIVDHINRHYMQEMNCFDANERIRLVDKLIRRIVPENKVNLMIYDGDYFYVHKNEEGTLYKSERPGSFIFSTHPLTPDGWEEVPQNQLLVYKDGELIYEGEKHEHTYIEDEENTKLLYLGYAGL